MEMRREEKAAAERKTTVIVGDMQPLVNSLPTIPARSGVHTQSTQVILIPLSPLLARLVKEQSSQKEQERLCK